uniref:RRM domain-containing protein n=1 Tax=Timema monikensis TaxID=170555 RepID=A0A7R9HUR2_9NEOP|nr:unnamed protein product [Timema monikensis]
MKISENEKQLLKVKGSNNISSLSKSKKRRLRRIRRASAPISEEVKPEGPKLTNSAKRRLRHNKKKLKLASGDLGDIKDINCKPTISFISTEVAKKYLAQEKKKLKHNLTKEELTKHFCKTTHQPKDVRLLMQKGSDTINKGFAYVEFSNEEGYLKGLKLHHSFLGGRRINVEYSASAKDKDTKKGLIKKKTLKLKALSSSGKI